jgi:topoisomerase IV subunit A
MGHLAALQSACRSKSAQAVGAIKKNRPVYYHHGMNDDKKTPQASLFPPSPPNPPVAGNPNVGGEDPDSLALAAYAERAYLDYAVSVVKGRALPDVADGLKPVQRRILYAMDAMGLGSTAKPVKSARVVGDVLGRFHPHGDQAAYDALVRLAQDFNMRYPLIDGQGNFGSRDGDGAAAMRYTEARLTAFSRLLLDEIDQGTVDFIPNYDGSTEEPALLPARLPIVLLNGASGIAVGMATEIPSHNLTEVCTATIALIKNPKITLGEVLTDLRGPDYPGGGQIISSSAEIEEIYRTGRGSLKVRARYKLEEMARGQWQWVIYELPPGVSTQKVLEEIEEITNPKIKLGKKALSPDQLALKQSMLAILDSVRDESGRDAPVRIVFEPKTSKIDQHELMQVLLAQTSLESSAPINLVMIGRDGRPAQKDLITILREWIEFRVTTIARRTQHRLTKVLDRIHILEGRQQVLLNIDEVIRIIRESDEPKVALIAAFKLSDRQAEDILEIRLRQLARLEYIKLEKELAELRTEQKGLEELLGSDSALRRRLIKEIEQDAKTFGDARRTVIEEAARASVTVKVIDEPVTVIVSDKGWVRARQGHGHDASQFAFKSGDQLSGAFEVRTADTLIAIASNGKALSVPVNVLPSARGDGVPITTLIELEPGARCEHVIAGGSAQTVVLATAGGFGFVAQMGDMISRLKAGKQFMTLEDKDQPILPRIVGPGVKDVLCVTTDGKALLVPLDEIKVLKNGGRGVTLMGLDKGDLLSAILPVDKRGAAVSGMGRGSKLREDVFTLRQLAEWRGARARKGKLLEPRVKEAKLSVPKIVSNDSEA